MKREGKAYTETKVIKGRAYHYLRFVVTVDGKRKERRIRIKAEPGTQEYDRLYWEAMNGKHAAPSRTNFKALVDNYMKSRRYTQLAEGTKQKYRPILASRSMRSWWPLNCIGFSPVDAETEGTMTTDGWLPLEKEATP